MKKKRKLTAEKKAAIERREALTAYDRCAGEMTFGEIQFPLVSRRLDGIAHTLTSIQPMTQPAGLIFYEEYKKQEELNESLDDIIESTLVK